MNYRNRNERLLAALRHFSSNGPRPMESAPKGVGWSTIHDLEAAGLLEQAGDASSIRGRPFRTTGAGIALLAASEPVAGLPKMDRWQPRQASGDRTVAPASSDLVTKASGRAKTLDLSDPGPRSPSRGRVRADRVSYPPRGLGASAAASYVGVSVGKFYEMVADGRMPPAKEIDRRRVWDRLEIDMKFDELPGGLNEVFDGGSSWETSL